MFLTEQDLKDMVEAKSIVSYKIESFHEGTIYVKNLHLVPIKPVEYIKLEFVVKNSNVSFSEITKDIL